MAEQTEQRAAVLQGTLDMLILRTLLYGPAHGHQIGSDQSFTTTISVAAGDTIDFAVGDGTDGGYTFDNTGISAVVTGSSSGSADLFLRMWPSTTTVHQGDLITYAFPVWNLGPDDAVHEVLNTQVPEGTVFDYIRISGTPGLGTCTHTPYLGAGPIPIVCHENSVMALNTTWTVRLTVKVTAPAGTVITESAATMADTPDPNTANNTAISVSLTVASREGTGKVVPAGRTAACGVHATMSRQSQSAGERRPTGGDRFLSA